MDPTQSRTRALRTAAIVVGGLASLITLGVISATVGHGVGPALWPMGVFAVLTTIVGYLAVRRS
jgi:hypothetical protein